MSEDVKNILRWMEENADTKNVEGMARFGINSSSAFGLPMPMLRAKAKEYRKRHDIAQELWETGVHEAGIMASLVEDPALVTPTQMDEWTAGFDSWDTCDQCCINLFRKTPFAHAKIGEYVPDEREFVRRAGFVLIATLAVHDTSTADHVFAGYLSLIGEYSRDGRNFVRKAVNWALRQIGKRSMELNAKAVVISSQLAADADPAARWIGKDALRELSSAKTHDFIRSHRKKFGN